MERSTPSSAPAPRAPSDVVLGVVRGISTRDWSNLHEFYSADTVVHHPFALPEPTSMHGREALREHFARFAQAPVRLQVSDMVVYETRDPEVVVAMWNYVGEHVDTARAFRVSNIQVSRVRQGEIVESYDYHNHAFMAAVGGRLEEVIGKLTAVARGAS
jgi:uncharacterized protein